ncbi:MAG: type I restriction enzyme HsdR N-terminal domain-containing protein [Candidatus Eisenbacteria bacterium]
MNIRVPKKVAERLLKQVPAFQKILQTAKDRDVNESDTVTIVTDLLSDIFGFDKYSEITREHAVRRTFCDLAVDVGGETKFLMEVKAIGLTLKENHLRQAVNYGANHGVQWVVLTNGVEWEVYRLRFERPIEHELTCSFSFLDLNPRKKEDQAKLFILCREGLAKDAIEEFHTHVEIVNRFFLGAVIQSDPVLAVIRRELRRLSPETKISQAEISGLLSDVLTRDVMEGEQADRARARIQRASGKTLRKRAPRVVRDVGTPPPPREAETDQGNL